MSNYLKTRYSEDKRPHTSYPAELVNYLFQRFNLKPSMKLLEPGVGRGEFLREFKKLGLEVVGLDISPEAKDLSPDLHIVIEDSDSIKLPFDDNSFDVIYSKSFIEHLHNPSFFLNEAYRIIKPQGLLITLTPDWEVQYKKFYDDYTHITPFTAVSLEEIQKACGFKDVKVFKFRQLPLLWKYPFLNLFSILISPFVPLRTTNKYLRWSWELMLVGSGVVPKEK